MATFWLGKENAGYDRIKKATCSKPLVTTGANDKRNTIAGPIFLCTRAAFWICGSNTLFLLNKAILYYISRSKDIYPSLLIDERVLRARIHVGLNPAHRVNALLLGFGGEIQFAT